MSFVGVNSTRFVIKTSSKSCFEDVYVNGWNSYWLMQDSLNGPSNSRVSEMMKRGAQMGMTVCRTWAFNDGDSPNALQVSPGVFNERVFKGLDYVIVEARRHRIRLILSLVNNLKAFGGKAQYVRWAKEAGVNVSSSTDSFFSNAVIKNYYKAYVKAVVTRRNSLSGVKYSEEPAIFAWELINEPRCESSSSAPALENWIKEMAAYVKTSLGSDFIQNSAIENIDFASVHAYPHSWIPLSDLDAKVDYLSNWMDAHIRDGEDVLKKPVLFSEFGSLLRKKLEGPYDRDILLKQVYDKIYESAKKREAGAGVLIWQLLVEGMKQYRDEFSLVAREHPSTYNLMVQQSSRLKNISSQGNTKRKSNRTGGCLA
ncbi:Mannan endo-1,4-beta-mannosidase [Heracleum sosnowskyi]|uniref:mannan endo-1,4-beta-mannosidase n=1 Tax=Heracleum sosnowskyi TaxID=360622 RepID=A0AAD8I4K5_9APIA|nr:Mannan endo-1,4-beta-mannosidase [Heracleum sosnowskyi]